MGRAWLSIVGVGEDGLAGLSPVARAHVEQAEVLVGGRRHLAMLPEDGRLRLNWRSPLVDTIQEIDAFRGRPVVVVATGDPLWFGVGRLLGWVSLLVIAGIFVKMVGGRVQAWLRRRRARIAEQSGITTRTGNTPVAEGESQ